MLEVLCDKTQSVLQSCSIDFTSSFNHRVVEVDHVEGRCGGERNDLGADEDVGVKEVVLSWGTVRKSLVLFAMKINTSGL